MRFQAALLAPLLPALVAGIQCPSRNGFKIAFSEDFDGAAGTSPDTGVWNIMDAINTNNEVQTYTTSNQNLQISGGGTLQIVPRKSSKDGHWTSGRIETKGSWTPEAGKVMIMEANIALSCVDSSKCQGIWPAFWAVGDAMRHGTGWPLAGEIDIMEQVNGGMTLYGTTHCGTYPGGICNESTGLQGTTSIPNDGFHTYSATIDRTSSDWRQQSIVWKIDGNTYFTLTGAGLGDEAVWATLAHSPMYLLTNVAVGGSWPQPPNANTIDGYDAMMEVAYIAVYQST